MIRQIHFSPADLPELSPKAALAEWLVEEEGRVETGTPLCRYEVDKAVGVFASPFTGWLRRRFAEAGTRLSWGTTIGLVSDQPDEPLSANVVPGAPADDDKEFDWSEIDNVAGDPLPLDLMRKVIADRMTMSKRHIPCFYLTASVDMSGCVALRNGMRRNGNKATFNDMAIKACAVALTRHPKVASVYLRGGVANREELHVGFAAALPDDGLVVPVVKHADRLPLVEIASETRRLAAKAKSGQLTPEDCRGGVFSVSYLGGSEVDNFVAIVNPGEAGIMAMGKAYDTAVVVDGQICVRPMAKITMSADHRTMDGALAARFTSEVKRLLEAPGQLTGD